MALLLLPVAVLVLPTVGIPVLAHSRIPLAIDGAVLPVQNVSPFTRTAGGEISVTQSLPRDTSNGSAAVPMRQHSGVSILGLCLAVAYGFVVVGLSNRFVRAWLGLRRLKRCSSLIIDSQWQTKLAHWSKVLRVRHPVELRMSADVSVPMTFGWRCPVILVPKVCVRSCDETQRDAIVIHELTHISRGDFFWHALTQITASLYWIHPLIWLIRRQEGMLRERICDAFCSQHLSRETYGQALVRIAGSGTRRPAAALGMAMAHPSSLRRRLNDLENLSPARYSTPNFALRVLLYGTAGVVFGLIVIGTLTTRAAAQGTTEPPKSSAKPDNSKATAKSAPIQLPETMEGKVLDRQDNPVANARVTIRPDSTKSDAPEPWTATTDGQGRYTISTGNRLLMATATRSVLTLAPAHSRCITA